MKFVPQMSDFTNFSNFGLRRDSSLSWQTTDVEAVTVKENL